MCQCFCLESPSKLDPSFSTSRKTPTDNGLICSSWEVKAYGTLWPISVASSPRIAQKKAINLYYTFCGPFFLGVMRDWGLEHVLKKKLLLLIRLDWLMMVIMVIRSDQGWWKVDRSSRYRGTRDPFCLSPRWCTKNPGAIIRDVGISSCELGGPLDDGWEEVKKVGVIPNSLVMAVSGLSG